MRYGTSPNNLSNVVSKSSSVTNHSVQLDGLSPDTRYYYSVGDSSQTMAGGNNKHFFVTSPTIGTQKDTRIWVLGDSGTANNNVRDVRNAYRNFTGNRHTDLWVMLGDNAYDDGTDSEYQNAVFDIFGDMLIKSVLWSTLGNHDGKTANSSNMSGPYYDIFTFPRGGEAGGVASGTEAYYSFDYGNIHFVCLDSTETNVSPNGAMMTWLELDLAATTQEWIIAFWHHPPYTKGSHDSDDEGKLIEMRENALPLLEAAGVDLMLSGHSHSYERSMLIDGHYGDSSTFNSSHRIDSGDGRENGDGAYQKGPGGSSPNEGAVYVVAGSSGKISGGDLDHPVMKVSLNSLGSMALDIDGNRLDAWFLDEDGDVRDSFTIVKDGVQPSITANFEAAPTSGVGPLSVDFTDTSSGGVTQWAWDFGDGNTSTQRDPTHTYQDVGDYTVTLVASGPAGSDSRTRNDYIRVEPPATIAAFSGAPTAGDAPLTVSFDDASQGSISSRDWSFGDGGSSSLTNPSHTYDQPGTYTVSLTVSGASGTDVETKTGYIVVTDPVVPPPPTVADFSATPTSGEAPLTVDFSDLSQGAVSSVSWSFGDGASSTLEDPSHTYTQPGTYTVSLTAVGAGGTDTEAKTGFITVEEPFVPPPPTVADFSATPTSGLAPLTVDFSDLSLGEVTSISWSFGDGGSSTLSQPAHTYTQAGSYTVSLTAVGAGGSDTETKTALITVEEPDNPPPTTNPSLGLVPGDKVMGTLAKPGSGDHLQHQFRFSAVAGSVLTLRVSAKSAGLQPRFRLRAPGGLVLVTPTGSLIGDGQAGVSKLRLGFSGTYLLTVLDTAGVGGEYRMTTKVRRPPPLVEVITVGNSTDVAEFDFGGVANAELNVNVKRLKAKGDYELIGGDEPDLRVEFVGVEGPDGELNATDFVKTSKSGAALRIKKLSLEDAGLHTLFIGGQEATRGYARVKASLKLPKGNKTHVLPTPVN